MTGRLRSAGLLSWFGLFGAPAAWAAQHVAGFALTQATCNPINAGGGLHMDAWVVVVSALTLAVALASIASAVTSWRLTNSGAAEPPEARIHFVSVMGMAFSPLFAVIIVMSGLGAIFLPECVQG